jgi:predicted lipoprotein with Yx(FWY)xxD motif
MNTWRSASLAVMAAAVMALTSACGSENAAGTTTNGLPAGAAAAAPADAGYGATGTGTGAGIAGAGEASAAAGTTAGVTAAKSAGQMAVWESKELGNVLTDSEGFTLYRFDKDTPDPAVSNCTGDCETAWPIVLADGSTAAPGVDASLIGSVTRADGKKQLTIAGWPMYHYAQDTKAGDVKGQGVGGVWFASAPDGKKASASAAAGEAAGTGASDDASASVTDLPGLSVRNDPKLGEHVVDGKGMTVYVFSKDVAWPDIITACTGECLDKWPIVAPVDVNDTVGIQKKGYMVFDRPEGTKQQTINCFLLYTFANDKVPGDIKGQGVGGTWHAVSPNGKAILK